MKNKPHVQEYLAIGNLAVAKAICISSDRSSDVNDVLGRRRRTDAVHNHHGIILLHALSI